MRHNTLAVFAAMLLGLLLAGNAAAQDGCTVRVVPGGVVLSGCNVVTATPARTATPTRTATATRTPTRTPVATATPPAPAPGAAPVVNVPLLNAVRGDPALDANNWSVVWAGAMSPGGGYTQLRLVGGSDGLQLYAQQMTPTADGASFGLSLRGAAQTVVYNQAAGWEFGQRCGGGAGTCRGWSASTLLPWAALGGKPAAGDVWPLTLSAGGAEWRGVLRWGQPDYGGAAAPGATVLTLPLSADASLGGGTDCGADDDPNNGRTSSFFAEWGGVSRGAWGDGTIGLGAIPYANSAQNQWDTADWPCYARYIARWGLASIPPGAQVVSATVDVWRFGHGGYNAGDTGTTSVQVFDVAAAWDEAGVTWDNAPQPGENVSRTAMHECSDTECGRWYSLDVTEIVKRAIARGDTAASMLLYTAAGQYHSGKYIYTREGAMPPVVRIAYTLGGAPAWTATPIATASPTTAAATSTPTATATAASPTSTPTATATPLPATAQPTATVAPTSTAPATPTRTAGATYHLSPTGNDAAAGTLAAPWRTFARAWTALQPGDTLLLLDGTYTESIRPGVRNGRAGAPITVRALNDGRAVIDGGGVRRPVEIGRSMNDTGPGSSYYVIEGIVTRNGASGNFIIYGSNNVLRRVSAYNADPDDNSSVIWIIGNNNLVEDAVAAGTGRYMVEVFGGNGNTIRRVFAQWERWDGRKFCGVTWPTGYNFGVYNASNTTLENVIAYGRVSSAGILVQANGDDTIANNNAVLGSMALLSGRDYDGSIWRFGSPTWPAVTRPKPTSSPYNAAGCDDATTVWGWGLQRVGIFLYGQGEMQNNVFRDVLAMGNVGVGFGAMQPYSSGAVAGNVVDYATLTGNAEIVEGWEMASGGNILLRMGGVSVTNSRIAGSQWASGPGARAERLPQTPWPMGGRIAAELGVNVDAVIVNAVQGAR